MVRPRLEILAYQTLHGDLEDLCFLLDLGVLRRPSFQGIQESLAVLVDLRSLEVLVDPFARRNLLFPRVPEVLRVHAHHEDQPVPEYRRQIIVGKKKLLTNFIDQWKFMKRIFRA